MARYGIVPRSEPINAVIFQGTPSQLINLPAFIKGAVAILAVGIGFGYASTQWPVPWFIPVIAVLLVLGGVGLSYLQVKFTEFEIDVNGSLVARVRADTISNSIPKRSSFSTMRSTRCLSSCFFSEF